MILLQTCDGKERLLNFHERKKVNRAAFLNGLIFMIEYILCFDRVR